MSVSGKFSVFHIQQVMLINYQVMLYVLYVTVKIVLFKKSWSVKITHLVSLYESFYIK